MAKYMIAVTCLCGHTTNHEWKPGFETRCEQCSKVVDYCKAAIDGRVRTSDGQLIKMWNKKKEKRGRK